MVKKIKEWFLFIIFFIFTFLIASLSLYIRKNKAEYIVEFLLIDNLKNQIMLCKKTNKGMRILSH